MCNAEAILWHFPPIQIHVLPFKLFNGLWQLATPIEFDVRDNATRRSICSWADKSFAQTAKSRKGGDIGSQTIADVVLPVEHKYRVSLPYIFFSFGSIVGRHRGTFSVYILVVFGVVLLGWWLCIVAVSLSTEYTRITWAISERASEQASERANERAEKWKS